MTSEKIFDRPEIVTAARSRPATALCIGRQVAIMHIRGPGGGVGARSRARRRMGSRLVILPRSAMTKGAGTAFDLRSRVPDRRGLQLRCNGAFVSDSRSMHQSTRHRRGSTMGLAPFLVGGSMRAIWICAESHRWSGGSLRTVGLPEIGSPVAVFAETLHPEASDIELSLPEMLRLSTKSSACLLFCPWQEPHSRFSPNRLGTADDRRPAECCDPDTNRGVLGNRLPVLSGNAVAA